MTNGISRLRKVGLGAIAAVTATAGLIPLALDAGAASNLTVTRIAGTDRFDTARLVAEKFGTSPTIVIARGDVFADALAGAYLAGVQPGGAAILLTRSDSIPPALDQAITQTGATKAFILGGTTAISTSVENALKAKGLNPVERLGGATRFDTAKIITERAGNAGANVGDLDNTTGPLKTAIVTTGINHADAVAGSPVSFAKRFPILLTAPGTLSQQARDGIVSQQIKQVLLLGGPAAVTTAVEDAIKAIPGVSVVTRVAGANRAGTAVEIAKLSRAKMGFTNKRIGIARGDDFADALSYGPLAGKTRPTIAQAGTSGPNNVLLTLSPTVSGAETIAELTALQPTVTEMEILGGPVAITPATETELTNAAKGQAGSGSATVGVSPTTVAPGGGPVTVTVGGGANVGAVTVSGCGLTQGTAVRSGTGSATVNIPANTANCTLTFTVNFNDGTAPQTINQPITVNTGGGGGGGGGGTVGGVNLLTAGPDLRSVTVLNATINDGQPNTVKYTFDSDVVTLAITPANTFLMGYNDLTAQPNLGTGFGVDPGDPKSVIVQFPDTVDVRSYTIGVVGSGSVFDASGRPNILSSKPLSGSNFVANSGQTAAPDLVSVTIDAGSNQATFKYDQKVDPATVVPTSHAFYDASGTLFTGAAVVGTPTESSVTIQFGGTAQVAQAVRFINITAAVTDQPPASVPAPVGHTDGLTSVPDITGVAKVAGTANQFDFTFDAPVDTLGCAGGATAPSVFQVVTDGAQILPGTAITRPSSTVVRVTAGGVNQNNQAEIVLGQYDPVLTGSGTVVCGVSAPKPAGTIGSFAIAQTNANAGLSDGPDLLSAAFDATGNQVTFNFDEVVNDGAGLQDPTKFFVVNAGAGVTAGLAVQSIVGKSITITFPVGTVSAAVGAGVVSPLIGETIAAIAAGPAVVDFATPPNNNSPTSVGGGPAAPAA